MSQSPPSTSSTAPPFVVGIPREIHAGERRVAATPATIKALRKAGVEVVIESGAGQAASYTDAQHAEAGARVVPTAAEAWAADLVLKVRPPEKRDDGTHEADLLPEHARLLSFIWPAQNPELVKRLAGRKATVLAMDCVPRITRAQRMDALSATANVAGYRAVIEATHHFGRFLPGQITAAGRVAPAQVLVVGAGVAGLAAIAAARGLGAVVKAFDTRPAVREQVESLGAQFLEFKFDESGEGEGGYAKQVSDAYLAAEQALLAQHAKTSDIIITTALIPGKPAPQLITSGAVVSMGPGSVIVDLAAEQGGNCALTEPGKVVEKFGVTIVGLTDLPSRMARQSSDLYATTALNLVADILEDGAFALDQEDEVHRGVLVLLDGEMKWPPPKRPEPRAGAPAPQPTAATHAPAPPAPQGMTLAAKLLLGAVTALLLVAGVFGPPEFVQHLTVFLLACVVGWHVVWEVTPALHTPLMSVTNAISGIIVIGGMVVLGSHAGAAAMALGALAVLLAAINVAGGFLVTQRMLRMFRR